MVENIIFRNKIKNLNLIVAKVLLVHIVNSNRMINPYKLFCTKFVKINQKLPS